MLFYGRNGTSLIDVPHKAWSAVFDVALGSSRKLSRRIAPKQYALTSRRVRRERSSSSNCGSYRSPGFLTPFFTRCRSEQAPSGYPSRALAPLGARDSAYQEQR